MSILACPPYKVDQFREDGIVIGWGAGNCFKLSNKLLKSFEFGAAMASLIGTDECRPEIEEISCRTFVE
jgi:hypothetical protein